MTAPSLGTPFLQDAPYPGPAAVASGILSGAESSGYVLVPLREGADFTLYRGRQHCNPSPVLVVALTGEQPSPQSLRRLEHEYSLYLNLRVEQMTSNVQLIEALGGWDNAQLPSEKAVAAK